MCCYRSRLFELLLLRHGISQGNVATHLRCGGIFSDIIITNVLPIQAVKRYENRSIFDVVKAYEVEAYKKSVPVFWDILYTAKFSKPKYK